jgi:hypothetical protein
MPYKNNKSTVSMDEVIEWVKTYKKTKNWPILIRNSQYSKTEIEKDKKKLIELIDQRLNFYEHYLAVPHFKLSQIRYHVIERWIELSNDYKTLNFATEIDPDYPTDI